MEIGMAAEFSKEVKDLVSARLAPRQHPVGLGRVLLGFSRATVILRGFPGPLVTLWRFFGRTVVSWGVSPGLTSPPVREPRWSTGLTSLTGSRAHRCTSLTGTPVPQGILKEGGVAVPPEGVGALVPTGQAGAAQSRPGMGTGLPRPRPRASCGAPHRSAAGASGPWSCRQTAVAVLRPDRGLPCGQVGGPPRRQLRSLPRRQLRSLPRRQLRDPLRETRGAAGLSRSQPRTQPRTPGPSRHAASAG